MTNSSLRLGLVAFLCAGLGGCVAVATALFVIPPAAGLGSAAVAVATEAPHLFDEQAKKKRCADFTARGIAVTEQLESAIPADEGVAHRFDPITWRPEFESEGYPRGWSIRKPKEGMLAITERSVLFVAPSGIAGVRIPLEVVLKVEVDSANPHSIFVDSLCGRSDTFAFWQREPNTVNPAAAAAAAALVKARVAAFQVAHKETEPTR